MCWLLPGLLLNQLILMGLVLAFDLLLRLPHLWLILERNIIYDLLRLLLDLHSLLVTHFEVSLAHFGLPVKSRGILLVLLLELLLVLLLYLLLLGLVLVVLLLDLPPQLLLFQLLRFLWLCLSLFSLRTLLLLPFESILLVFLPALLLRSHLFI